MRWWVALAMVTAANGAFWSSKQHQAVEQPQRELSKAERNHLRHFMSIGEGFEGTASDWTEYVVWLVGVVGVFCYMANPNMRRNLHAVQDEDDLSERWDANPPTDHGKEE